tara:strand:- start:2016 stop:2168 length:153 start_codon:yes stop_codon:yes gene_type:complete
MNTIILAREYKQLNRTKNYKSNLKKALNNGWIIEIEEDYSRTLLSRKVNN